jgi:hypothetical protein
MQRGIRQHQDSAQRAAAQPGAAQLGFGQQRGADFHRTILNADSSFSVANPSENGRSFWVPRALTVYLF